MISALGHDKAQSIIDQITAAYESGGGPPPGGFGFGPHHLGAPPPPFPGHPMGFGGPPGAFPRGYPTQLSSYPETDFFAARPPFPPGPFPPPGMMGPPFPPSDGMPPPAAMGPPGGFPGGKSISSHH